MFVHQHAAANGLRLDGIVSTPAAVEGGQAKFDLLMIVTEGQEGVACTVEYAAASFDASFITRMLLDYSRVLQAVIDAPDEPLSRLSQLSGVQRCSGDVVLRDERLGDSATASAAPHAEASNAAPTADEYMLIAIWQEILPVERIGVHDSFFDLGGHSLLATQIISRVRDVFGIRVPVRTVFDAPTPRQFAGALNVLRQAPVSAYPAAAPLAVIPRLERRATSADL
jgi:hypothetical protein